MIGSFGGTKEGALNTAMEDSDLTNRPRGLSGQVKKRWMGKREKTRRIFLTLF